MMGGVNFCVINPSHCTIRSGLAASIFITSALLMERFYGGLKTGKGKGAALRGAELSLLKQPRYRHPYYWAPFVLMGEWR